MADETKRTGGEPAFDTDRAWARFEKLTAHEPVPAFWRQADESGRQKTAKKEPRWGGDDDHPIRDGAMEMKETGIYQTAQGSPVTGDKAAPSAASTNGADVAWRTERPAKRLLRRLTAGVAAAAVVIGLFTTPLGDRALALMQNTFRIQHVVGVGMSADDMASISDLLDRGSPEGDQSFKLAQYGSLTQSGGGKIPLVTWEEAEQRMGSQVLKLEKPSILTFQPATTVTLTLSVKSVNRLLTRLGSDTTLPAEADGKAIRFHIPGGLTTVGTLSGHTVRLLQFGKPELTVEDGIDAATVREAVLGLPVLPDSLRTQLSAIGDWQSTLPVPARDGTATSLRLGGHDAVMTMGDKYRHLLWLDGDRMSLLSGGVKDFPTEAAFKQAAEELIRP